MAELPFGQPASINNIAFDTGRIAERQEIIKLLEKRVCFDFKRGDCDSAACAALAALIIELKRKPHG